MNETPRRQSTALRLAIVDAPDQAPVLLAPGERLIVGRGNDCGLWINHVSVSRNHAVLAFDANGATVEDLGSRHGTRVNGVPARAKQPVPVRAGDVLQFGPTSVRVGHHVERIATQLDPNEADDVHTIVFGARGGAEHAMRVLIDVVRTIPLDGDEESAGQMILERLIAATRLERGLLVRVLDANTDAEIVASAGTRGGPVSRTVLAAAEDLSRVAHLSQELDIRGAESIAGSGVREAVCARIVADGAERLYLYLDSRQATSSVDAGMAEFVGAAARIIGLVLESFQRRRLEELRQDVARARLVQERLMPLGVGENSAVRWCLKSVPGAMLAGDFAGMLTRSDGAVFAWVGDVAGKGPAAAMLMATAQAWLHGAGTHLDPLGAIATRLNEFIFERSDVSEFVTLFMAVIHADGKTEVCDAGHGIAFCVADGAAHRLDVEGGPPLGAVSGIEYSTSMIELSPAARLVMVTDGVHEQRSIQGEQFSLERMRSLLSSNKTCESDVEHLVRDLATFANARFDDDVTILSIQRIA